MKAELELSIDTKTGLPKIKIRHHDKSNDVEQLLLKVFVDKGLDGIKMVKTSEHIECGTNNSWENYEIIIHDGQQKERGTCEICWGNGEFVEYHNGFSDVKPCICQKEVL